MLPVADYPVLCAPAAISWVQQGYVASRDERIQGPFNLPVPLNCVTQK